MESKTMNADAVKQRNLILPSSCTVDEYEAMANKLMNKHWHIEYPKNHYQVLCLADLGYRWNYDNRKTTLGRANRDRKLIRISKWFLDANLDGKAQVMEDVFRHEIAHCLDYELRGSSDHGRVWKSLAVQVGARPERLNGLANEGRFKWTLRCNNCGEEYHRHRKSRRIKACRSCCVKHNNGKFDMRFKLEDIKNF